MNFRDPNAPVWGLILAACVLVLIGLCVIAAGYVEPAR